MQLIGMLDSPYVRRTAISLKLMGFEFELKQISVLRAFDEFKAINPVVKAPSLVTDDGQVLMDSSLILEYAEHLAPSKSLMPAGTRDQVDALRLIGLALAAAEKTVQTLYEKRLRPADKQHQPWLDRVRIQLQSACRELEKSAPKNWFGGSVPNQADITVAVTWRFIQSVFPELAPAVEYPGLAAHSARAEKLPAFIETDF